MNSREQVIEKANKYWDIIDNGRIRIQQIKNKTLQPQSLKSDSFPQSFYPFKAYSTLHLNNEISINNDFLLIINNINKVIYCDINALKLWNVSSPQTLPIVNFSINISDLSHQRTICAELVLSENQAIEIIIEKLDYFSTLSIPQDLLFLIRPVNQKIENQKGDNNHHIQFKNSFADKREKSKMELDLNNNQKLAEKMPLQILLAEDNLINQKLFIQVLHRMGYNPDTSLNGAEAIKLLKKKRYDIIFMDVQMPVMDGLETTRNIVSQWPKEERPHIIAMTANVNHGDREKCMNAGMDDYLTKPIVFNELTAALLKWGNM